MHVWDTRLWEKTNVGENMIVMGLMTLMMLSGGLCLGAVAYSVFQTSALNQHLSLVETLV
jgi:hypothetical protein